MSKMYNFNLEDGIYNHCERPYLTSVELIKAPNIFKSSNDLAAVVQQRYKKVASEFLKR